MGTALDDGVDRSGLRWHWALTPPARLRCQLLEAEPHVFRARVAGLAHQTRANFLQGVRWWRASRDPKLLRPLTAVARAFPGAPLALAYAGPRRSAYPWE